MNWSRSFFAAMVANGPFVQTSAGILFTDLASRPGEGLCAKYVPKIVKA
jgi:hypothetical protein